MPQTSTSSWAVADQKGKTALNRINKERGNSLKASMSVIQIDATDPKSIGAAKDEIVSGSGKLDILIKDAGIFLIHPAISAVDQLRKMFEPNVFGPNMIVEMFEPLLRNSSDMRIINVSSDHVSARQDL